MNTKRIWGVILRHLYNFRHSVDRWTDAFYWPAVDIILWGITTRYFMENSINSFPNALLILLSALVFWQAIWRGANELTTCLLEEMWNRNLMPLFATPLTVVEWLTGLIILSFIKMVITVAFCIFLSWILYSVNILSVDFLLVPFIFSLLVMGLWVGIFISGIIIRFGQRIQTLAWSGAVILMPFCAIFYPLSFLPNWAQLIAKAIPGAYIFEGMRKYLTTGQIPVPDLLISYGLNFLYFIFSLWFFNLCFQKRREIGLGSLE